MIESRTVHYLVKQTDSENYIDLVYRCMSTPHSVNSDTVMLLKRSARRAIHDLLLIPRSPHKCFIVTGNI